MNNCYFFKGSISSLFNQKKHGSAFLNFIFWKIAFFLLVPLATASIIDESYSSHQDVYDAILNTLFPITFVILFNISNKKNEKVVDTVKPEDMQPTQYWFTKNNLLPLLDDILYNTVTWDVPVDFLATSTTMSQYEFYKDVKRYRGTHKKPAKGETQETVTQDILP
ncbi:hypothetical protein Glove_63g115 [Diversispora epigaea]|uniref:Uncharacterized protein n=1 Tax=Diversispora epigaea TaxID=1348612 RepID=A0A397JI37_9GLOM|nr:hypothetical protein Glove_63g115 [Diversispora epigaea]